MVQSKILLNVTLAKNNLYCPFTLNKWSTILTYKTTMNLIWNNFGSQINILLFKNVRISVETYFEWEGYIDVVDGCWGQFVLASFSHWKHQHSNDFAIYNCHHHNLWFIKSPANFMLHNVVTSIIVAEWNYYLKQTVLANKLSSEFFGRKQPTSLSSIIRLNSLNFRILNLILCYLIDGRITVIRFLTIFCWFWRFHTPVTRHNNPNNEIFCL